MSAISTFLWRRPEMRRTMKLQRETDPAWAQEVASRPGCEGLFSCLGCGTCSGTCPLSIYMDLGPRRVIALVREGFREDALTSQTIWLCASCYSCDVECPCQIRLTDLMGSLKREAVRREIFPRRFDPRAGAGALSCRQPPRAQLRILARFPRGAPVQSTTDAHPDRNWLAAAPGRQALVRPKTIQKRARVRKQAGPPGTDMTCEEIEGIVTYA